MTKFTRTIALLAGFAAFAPMAAQAAPLFTPHARLVQEINSAYGTQFKSSGQTANLAAAHNTGGQHSG